MISIKIFEVSNFGVNSFVLHDETGECIFIDAGYYYTNEQEMLKNYVESMKLKPVLLLCTHCHVDHIFGNKYITETYKVPLAFHKEDEFLRMNMEHMGKMFGLTTQLSPPADKFIDDNEVIKFGNSNFQALHVPGHSPGSLAYYFSSDKFVIAGDTLFKGSIGRTDLPGGDYDTLVKKISSKLLTLPSDTTIYPGHGISTTIKEEHDTNPFFV